MKTTYKEYKYTLLPIDGFWIYKIYHPEYDELPAMRESMEYFETKLQAQSAAMEHIDLLTDGDGQ